MGAPVQTLEYGSGLSPQKPCRAEVHASATTELKCALDHMGRMHALVYVCTCCQFAVLHVHGGTSDGLTSQLGARYALAQNVRHGSRRGVVPDAWSCKKAQEYMDLAAGKKMSPHVMPQLDAYVDGPRRPLAQVERDLLAHFPYHKLGPRPNGMYGSEAGQPVHGRGVAVPLWRP